MNRALGLTGAGAPITEMQDGHLEQVIDVAPIVRRGRTITVTGGIFTGILQNVHGAANTVTSQETPFDIAVGRISPFPTPLPRGFDLWLLAASVRRVSGTGAVSGLLSMDPLGASQAFGINSAGVAVVAQSRFFLVAWEQLQSMPSDDVGLDFTGQSYVKIGTRLLRGCNLLFTTTSAAATTLRCELLLGLFPIALGQDIFV